MNIFFATIFAVAWKDILLELRTKNVITAVLTFALVSMVIFSFAFEPTPKIIAIVAPGILWVAITFAGLLGLNRSFSMEEENESLEGLLLCPVTRDVIYFGKLLGIFLFMLVAEVILLPVFAILYNLDVFEIGMFVIMTLTTLGFAGIGTLFSAIAVNTRSREMMLPMLLLPLASPIIIAAVESTRIVLDGGTWSEIGRWWQLILAFDVIFLIASSFVFGSVLEE
ncbi:MAG: heme ABC transporter permease CcmB [SAR202 cluster bacterium Io17-Chloro-G3]|nr:MAG: heme ABC transporter permease CcmB [SAR202 cluster bacterium Io17-Chloro-G3]